MESKPKIFTGLESAEDFARYVGKLLEIEVMRENCLYIRLSGPNCQNKGVSRSVVFTADVAYTEKPLTSRVAVLKYVCHNGAGSCNKCVKENTDYRRDMLNGIRESIMEVNPLFMQRLGNDGFSYEFK